MWSKLTVGQYQALYEIITDQTFEHEVDRQIHLLACLTGRPVHHYEAMPFTRLQQEVEATRFLHEQAIPAAAPPKYIKAGGRVYRPVYDFRSLASGQFIDAMTCVKEPDQHVPNMHLMLAAICRPTKRTLFGRQMMGYGAEPFAQVADAMKGIPVIQAQAVALFFWNVWETLLKSMPDFLEEKKKRKMTESERKMWETVFPSVGAG